MVSENALIEEFKFMGIDKLDMEVIIKCMEIASKYKIDAERLVEEWITFAQTNLSGNLQPSIVNLDVMVRKQFEKTQEKVALKSEPVTPNNSKIKVYNSNSSDVMDIMHVYGAGTPKKTIEEKRQLEDLNESASFSPASHKEEASKPSKTYAERTDKGKEVDIFGSKVLLEQDLHTKPCKHVSIKFLGNYESWNSSNARYMFEAPEIEAKILNNRIEKIGNILLKKYETDANKNELTYGRVRADGDGRLNAYSVLLETSIQHGKGEAKIVNLQQIQRLSFFPGQIILLQATLKTNAIRQNYLASEHLYHNAIPDLPEEEPTFNGPEPMKIVVASGPYTLSDNLVYEPLQDLLKYIVTNQPNILILIGPFVDMRHKSVTDDTMAETYKSHFENLMEQIVTPLKDTNIQIIVVPSTLDAHHHSVYPTPPFELPKHKFNSSQIHMASDPSLININNLIVGVTSADVLFHLAKTEFTQSPYNVDRMARFSEHILSQRSFYPIYPAQQAAPGQIRLSIDYQLMSKHGEFDVMPHILILPSNLKHFIKKINGCIVINPERLSKGFVGGSFASINIYPSQNRSSVEQNITCKIIKI